MPQTASHLSGSRPCGLILVLSREGVFLGKCLAPSRLGACRTHGRAPSTQACGLRHLLQACWHRLEDRHHGSTRCPERERRFAPQFKCGSAVRRTFDPIGYRKADRPSGIEILAAICLMLGSATASAAHGQRRLRYGNARASEPRTARDTTADKRRCCTLRTHDLGVVSAPPELSL
jgi:hypothetical protein